MVQRRCSLLILLFDHQGLRTLTRTGLMSHENLRSTVSRNISLVLCVYCQISHCTMQVLQQECQRKIFYGPRPGLEVEDESRRHAQAFITVGGTI
jgi:hypothetical protein